MLRIWTAQDAAKITAVPYRTVLRWISSGLVGLPLHGSEGRRTRFRLVEDDLFDLWTAASLRQQGVSLRRVRQVLVSLDRYSEHQQQRIVDLAAIVIRGDEVIALNEPITWRDREPGQLVIRVDAFRRRLENTPGEVLPEAWELLLMVQGGSIE